MWKIKAPIFQQNNIKLYVIFYGDDDEYIYIFFKPDDDEINEGMNDSLGPHMGKAQQVGLFGRAETRGP